jgi:alanine racemase
MARPIKAVIDKRAIRHNLTVARARHAGGKIVAVVKADGYGHGAQWVAEACREADAYAVSSVEEALILRAAFPDKPIMLLEGFFSADDLRAAESHHLWPVVHSWDQIRLLHSFPLHSLQVWIKLDTGLNRLGFRVDDYDNVLEHLQTQAPNVAVLGVMSHLSSADEPDSEATMMQYKALEPARRPALALSVATSAGLLGQTPLPGEWVRPGIMLYGASPFPHRTAEELGLRPAMEFESALISVRACRRGEGIGYGSTWICPEDMLVGTVAAGYGDGYPRTAAPGTPVLVNGRRAPRVGRVCMDMLMVDLRSQPDARPGDRVVLWGKGLPVEEIAAASGTIPNDVLTSVTSRVARVLSAVM